MEKEGVWRSILKSRYVNLELKVIVSDKNVVSNSDSIRWRDLLTSDDYVNLMENHFAGSVNCCVGNGKDTPFWYAKWVGNQYLMEAFPEIFVEEVDDKVSVASTGCWSIQG